MTARGPVAEAVVADAPRRRRPGVDVRRGVAVTGVVTDGAGGGAVRVTGVVTETGERIAADLVVDAVGRRSALPEWLGNAGGARARSRSARTAASSTTGATSGRPTAAARPRSVRCSSPTSRSRCSRCPPTTAPGASASSPARGTPTLRALRKTRPLERVVRAASRWSPTGSTASRSTSVAVMAKIEDRHRSYVRRRCAGGHRCARRRRLVGVHQPLRRARHLDRADARRRAPRPAARRSASTTVELADRVGRGHQRPSSPGTEPRSSSTATAWPRSRRRSTGGPTRPTIPQWHLTKCLEAGAGRDPELLRGMLAIAGVLDTPEVVFARPGFAERTVEVGEPWIRDALPGPDPGRTGRGHDVAGLSRRTRLNEERP